MEIVSEKDLVMTRLLPLALLVLWTTPGWAGETSIENYCEVSGVQAPCEHTLPYDNLMPHDDMTPRPPAVDHSWHLLIQTYGGTVTLLKDLTEDECEKTRVRVTPIYEQSSSHFITQ